MITSIIIVGLSGSKYTPLFYVWVIIYSSPNPDAGSANLCQKKWSQVEKFWELCIWVKYTTWLIDGFHHIKPQRYEIIMSKVKYCDDFLQSNYSYIR